MPVVFQRIENVAIAIGVVALLFHLEQAWWWLPALFLVFDLSMVGYLVSPRLGAWTYNLAHNYAVVAAVGGLAWAFDSTALTVLALAWGFHVAVDRGLGYGLKFCDRFTHTHLGTIGGEPRKAAAVPDDD